MRDRVSHRLVAHTGTPRRPAAPKFKPRTPSHRQTDSNGVALPPARACRRRSLGTGATAAVAARRRRFDRCIDHESIAGRARARARLSRYRDLFWSLSNNSMTRKNFAYRVQCDFTSIHVFLWIHQFCDPVPKSGTVSPQALTLSSRRRRTARTRRACSTRRTR
jgi:hypothetical protein